MSRFVRLGTLLAAACLIVASPAGRPAADSGEQSSPESAELRPQDPAAGIVVVDAAAFARALRARLSGLSDGDLWAVHQGLLNGAGPAEDVMMGDAPAATSLAEDASLPPCPDGAEPSPANGDADANNTSEARMRRRESAKSAETVNRYNNNSSTLDKKLMLQNIQSKVLNLFNANGRTLPSPSPLVKTHSNLLSTMQIANQQIDALRLLRENVKSVPSFSAALYTEKTQSFYPICDIPRHTHEDVWNAKDLMNLMFNISFPKPASGNSVNVSVAKLRLYKQLVSCSSQNSNETIDDAPNCQPLFSEETIKLSNMTSLSSSAEVPLVIEDKQIRVSVYLYTRSLRKKRVKRKLLDSRMLMYFDEKWTEWNIGSAVKSWHREPNRNYGLSIEVEDEDGNLLPVNRFFRPMNCTGDVQMTTPKPIPGFLIEQAQRDYSLQTPSAGDDPRPPNASTLEAFSFNLFRYPMIDVTTIEVPDSEVNNAVLFQYAKNLIEQNLAAGRAASRPEDAGPGRPRKPDQDPSTDQAELHKIRHGGGNNGRHRAANVDADTSEAAGREFRDRIIMKSIVYKNPKAPASRSTIAPAESA